MRRVRMFLFLFITISFLIHFFWGCSKNKISQPLPQPSNPAIVGFSPTSDSIGGTITIIGSNFNADTSKDIVKFNSDQALVLSATSTKLIVKVPSGATTGLISVSVNGHNAVSSSSFTVSIVSVLPSVTILSFTPRSDTIGGLVTINGANFNEMPANNIVKFNGTSAVVNFATISKLIAVVPSGTTNGKITVAVNGYQTATSIDSFILLPPVISSFFPLSATVGALVTISGFNFSSNISYDSVRFNGQTAVVVSATSTQIIVLVPDYAIIGNITVKVGTQTTTSSDIFTIYGVSTLAGISNGTYQDGVGASAYFSYPKGLATDAQGNIYVADFQNQRIRKVTQAGVSSTLAGTGVNGSIDGVGTNASFNEPLAVAVDVSGNVFVADNANNKIRKITTDGMVSTFANIEEPLTLCVDKNGNVYAGCSGIYGLLKFTPDGAESIFAGDSILQGFADGQGAAARFGGVSAITIDNDQNIYVIDQSNAVVRQVSPTGNVITVAGQPNKPGTQDGPLSIATLYTPYAIAVDGNKNIYITELDKVRKVNLLSGTISTFAGQVTISPLSLNGSFLNATFDMPSGICVDQNGIVYVSSLNEIRRITAH